MFTSSSFTSLADAVEAASEELEPVLVVAVELLVVLFVSLLVEADACPPAFNAFCVAGPAIPSTCKLLFSWNLRTDCSV